MQANSSVSPVVLGVPVGILMPIRQLPASESRALPFPSTGAEQGLPITVAGLLHIETSETNRQVDEKAFIIKCANAT